MVNINKNGVWKADGSGVGENLILNSSNLSQNNIGSADGSKKEYMYFNLGNGYMNIPSGTEVTISFDLEMVVKTAPPKLFIYNTNNKGPKQIAGVSLDPQISNYKVGDTIKERFSVNTTILDRSSSQTTNYIEFYSQYGSSNFYKISNIKLEKGSVATPWIPNSTDAIYVSNSCGFIEGYDAKIWSGTIGGEEFIEL